MSELPVASPRFLKLEDVAEELSITMSQTYALVRSGELAAIKIGGRGQWRVERTKLEKYIAAAYSETRAFVREHPFAGQSTPDGEPSVEAQGQDPPS